MTQKAFYLDGSACAGCKACAIACKDKNDLPLGVNWRHVIQYGGGSWNADPTKTDAWSPNQLFVYSLSISCQHCEDPICANVCPTAAITKRDDGIVLIDTDVCIGCRYCEWACPYGAPAFNEEAKYMTKCDFCADLQDAGQNPACVDACVMRCLDYGDLDELRAKYGDQVEIEPLPTASITKPALVITPHKHAQATGTGTGRILNLPEELI